MSKRGELPAGAELQAALVLARDLKKKRDIAGAQVDYPYHKYQLADALIVLCQFVGWATPVSHEEHIKVVRQLTAATARLAKYEKPSRLPE